jgi:hypothetical protein
MGSTGPNLALGSIAASATATAFRLVSLSKMPRSNFLPSTFCPEAFPIKANDYSGNLGCSHLSMSASTIFQQRCIRDFAKLSLSLTGSHFH